MLMFNSIQTLSTTLSLSFSLSLSLLSLYMYIHTCTCIYFYVYIHIPRSRALSISPSCACTSMCFNARANNVPMLTHVPLHPNTLPMRFGNLPPCRLFQAPALAKGSSLQRFSMSYFALHWAAMLLKRV